MVSDVDFVNSQYVVFYDSKNPEILLAMNQAISRAGNILSNINHLTSRDVKELSHVGKITLDGVSSTTPFLNLEYSNLVEDQLIYPVLAIAQAFEKEGEYEFKKSLEIGFSRAKSDGDLVQYRDRMDFHYDGGFRKLIGNIVIEARINAIKYSGEVEQPKGTDLDLCWVSDKFRDDEELGFATQLFGFIDNVGFNSFRSEPGQSGWDCDVTGACRYGVKYHRIKGSSDGDYSFENGIGTFKCALGMLQGAKGIQFLSLDETFQRFGRWP
jgi:hypothetical protein